MPLWLSPAPQAAVFATALRLIRETVRASRTVAVHLGAPACYAAAQMSKAKPTSKSKTAPAKAKASPKPSKPVQVPLEAAKPARKTAPAPKPAPGKSAPSKAAGEKPAAAKAGVSKPTAGKAATAGKPAQATPAVAKKAPAGKGKKSAPVAVAPPPYVSPFKSGDKVTHTVFGPGNVTGVEGERLVIKFSGGEKTILDSFVKAAKA